MCNSEPNGWGVDDSAKDNLLTVSSSRGSLGFGDPGLENMALPDLFFSSKFHTGEQLGYIGKPI